MAADAVIIFTETEYNPCNRWRHVEFGLALAQDKGVIIVGPRENVFHYLLPDSQMFAPGTRHLRQSSGTSCSRTRSVRKLSRFEHRNNSVRQ